MWGAEFSEMHISYAAIVSRIEERRKNAGGCTVEGARAGQKKNDTLFIRRLLTAVCIFFPTHFTSVKGKYRSAIRCLSSRQISRVLHARARAR